MSDYRVVQVICRDEQEAKNIARILLKKKQVACANIIPRIQSLYWWKDRIVNDYESILLLKTKAKHVASLIEEIKSNHSYVTPSVLAIDVDEGNKDYFDWIDDEIV
jgi:periplasmic divalent cation tolerance protein